MKSGLKLRSVLALCLWIFTSANFGLAVAETFNPETDVNQGVGQGYAVPEGEQPNYEETYRPAVPKNDLVLEVNPLLLINRGVSAEFEKFLFSSIALGGDVLYRDAEVYDDFGVTGRTQYLGVAAKLRFYPFETLAGVFFGAKLFVGQSTLTISDSQKKSERALLTLTPAAHAGYRFTSFSGFTLAVYVGGGLNIPRVEFREADMDESRRDNGVWRSAKNSVNSSTGLFKPDYGITLGIAL